MVFNCVNAQTVKLIPNPDTTSEGFSGYWIHSYKGLKLSMYKNQNGKYQLAKLNNSGVSLISNPTNDGSIFLEAFPINYNNSLYFIYQNGQGKNQLAAYDGSSVNLYNNPDTSFGVSGFFYEAYPDSSNSILNNQLLISYVDANSNTQLAKFENGIVSLPTHPDSTAMSSYFDGSRTNFRIHNNKFYFYGTLNYNNLLMSYNGSIVKIENIDTTNYGGLIYNTHLMKFNNELLFTYQDISSFPLPYSYLSKYVGNTFTKLKDSVNLGFTWEKYYQPLNYNGKIYYFYGYGGSNSNSALGLAVYDGKLKINIFSNLPQYSGMNSNLSLKAVGNNIYFNVDSYNFSTHTSSSKLGYFDGQSFGIVNNPDSGAGYFTGVLKGNFLNNALVNFNNNLFATYRNSLGKDVVTKTNIYTTSFVNTTDTSLNVADVFDYQNKLFIFSTDASQKGYLGKYNGTKFIYYKNPDSFGTLVYPPILHNDSFYVYFNSKGKYQIVYLSDSSVPTYCNPSISIAASTNSICYGTKVTFTATTQNAGTTPAYQWKKNNINVGVNSSVYIDSLLNQNDSLVCYVTSTNCVGIPTAKSNNIYIQFATNRNYAYLSSYDSSAISIVDLNTSAILNYIKTPSYSISVAISPNKQIAIFTSSTGNKPVILNTLNNSIIGYLPLNSRQSTRIIFNNDGSKIYYADSTMLRVFNANTYLQIDSFLFNPGLIIYDIKLNTTGDKIYVSNTQNIFELNANTLSINKTLNLKNINLTNNYYFLRCNKNNSKVYITGGKNTTANYGSLIVYDNANDSIIKKLDFSTGNLDLLLLESKNKLFFASVSSKKIYVLNTLNNIITDSITLLDTPFGIDSSADGNFIYVANGKYLTQINTTTNTIVQNIIVGNHLYSIGNFILQETSNCLSTKTISGNFITTLKKAVKNVNVKLSGNSSSTIVNDNLGKYNFTVVDGNYTLRPTKNNDITKANGINTTDVLFVQRHILNTTKLNSAYKLIAADVNGDKLINATDLLRIKRLILGTDTTFTKGAGINKVDRLWEFVDSAYQFPDTTNPFPFRDSISFTNLTSNKTNQTFIGIKLGDVNDSWNPAVARAVVTKPVELQYTISNKQLTTANEELGIWNSVIKIPITSNNFNELVALQYTLHFDNSKYEFIGIENNKLGIDFNEKQCNQNGNISFLWTDKNAVEKSLEDGTELFTLLLTQKGIGNLELGISDAITDIAAWDKNFNQHNIILTKRETINDKQEIRNESFSISPNPTNGEIKVNLISKVNKIVSFELTDAQGRAILKQAIELQKGSNNFTLNLKQNSNLTTGIYLLKAVGFDGDNVRRIMVK